ncbi:MAG TPA: choice-of-anchor D domain-containing protein [Candidatus Dormibacteraeota bacterium]|nr:choice-of-anchor D domain-containing protein [Candidatus Dormibacteraeota bacterium]
MAIVPSSIAFGSVAVGATNTQNVRVGNVGDANLVISQATVAGTAFRLSGLNVPLTIAPGQSMMFTASFTPTAAGPATGNLSVVSNAPPTPVTIALSGTGLATSSQLSASPSALSYGNVSVGTTATHIVTLTNGGNSSVSISQITPTGATFTVTGLALPLTLSAGQTAGFNVVFSPTSLGSQSGTVTILSTASNSPATVSASGSGIATPTPSISVAPSSIAFGTVAIGTTNTQTVRVSNPGNANLVISQATVAGTAFSVSGPSVPVTIAPGQSMTFTVGFTPSAGGLVTGSLSLASNAPTTPLAIPLNGTGLAPSLLLSASPSVLTYGNVSVGTTAMHIVTLTNTGNSNVSISQITPTGAAFTVTGLALPLALSAGQTAGFNVVFSPTRLGSQSGTVTILSTASNSPATVSASGSGIATPTPSISVAPSSIAFGTVAIGTTNTQTVRVSNPGNANLVISQATVAGTVFSVSGLSVPVTVAPGQSMTFTVGFTPSASGLVTASLSLASNAPTTPIAIPLSGTGLAASLLLSASPSALSFGDVSVGSSGTQTVTLTNTGNSDVSVSQVTPTGAAFSVTGLALPVTVSPGQTASLNVVFAPLGVGSQTSTVTIRSTASNSPAIVSAAGVGIQPVAHSATLSWDPSTSTVVGYYVYRGAQSGGPYTLLNSSSVAATGYPDLTVQAGLTYFYVVTAVDSSAVESAFSNEVSATIPTP